MNKDVKNIVDYLFLDSIDWMIIIVLPNGLSISRVRDKGLRHLLFLSFLANKEG